MVIFKFSFFLYFYHNKNVPIIKTRRIFIFQTIIIFKRPTSSKPKQTNDVPEITKNIYPKKSSPPSRISSVCFSPYEPYFSLVTLRTVEHNKFEPLSGHRFCTVQPLSVLAGRYWSESFVPVAFENWSNFAD